MKQNKCNISRLQLSSAGNRSLGKVSAVKALWAVAALQLRPQSQWLEPLAERLSGILPSGKSVDWHVRCERTRGRGHVRSEGVNCRVKARYDFNICHT
jgi:hypothetical protein